MADPERVRELSEQLLAARRLIVASNRGPYEYARDEQGERTTKRGSGGLVTALAPVGQVAQLTWIAAAMTAEDRAIAAEGQAVPTGDAGLSVRFVAVPAKRFQQHYNIICNQHLWFLQHYMWNTPRSPNISRSVYDAWENGYVRVNEAFADAIAAEAAADPTPPYVMTQDYHLYLAPKLVRQRLPGAIIQHFIHIPWPDPRYWALLPRGMGATVFDHLAAADVIGLQTERDARNLLLGMETFLPRDADIDYRRSTVWFDGHLTLVRAYPISVDAPGLQAFAAGEEVRRYEDTLAPLFAEQTVVRVDRMEPSKNLLRGFRAFELLIQRYPDLRGRVGLLAFMVPSRTDVGTYQTYTDEAFELIDAINDEYGSETWQPITSFYENNYAQAVAAMRRYDVLLVNPVIDGMNLVAKEGPLVNCRDGVLVLSETAGAFEQLGEHALAVAPADIEGTVRALYQALTMPAEERAARATALRTEIEANDLHAWLARQFEDLLSLS
jgi:trehalose 6-phosphate synthase